MNLKFSIIKFLFYVVAPALFFYSCQKELGYEAGSGPIVITPIDTILPPADTVDIDLDSLSTCSICNTASGTQEGTWAFQANNSILCGEIDTAYILNLSTITFTGPSVCSVDTGLLFIVYMSGVSFDRSFDNATAANSTFSYYHTGFPNILYSQLGQPFTLTITNYNHTTHIATGTFSGAGFRQDGSIVNISNGKFTIRLV